MQQNIAKSLQKRRSKNIVTDKTVENESKFITYRDLIQAATFSVVIDKLRIQLQERSKVY